MGVLGIYAAKSVRRTGRTQGSSPIPRYPQVGRWSMGAVSSLISRLCYGIAVLVCDLVIGCVRWLFTNIAKPIVLMLAGLAYILFLGLAIVVQSPIRAAQDWWSVKQSRKEMKKWSHASSHSRHAKLKYRQLASLSSIPSSW
ncbi:hypothetical protein LXA43DRAFT_376668 [Ganoderma leucocontextum]|nr:hypothetical protein LXA43DRAFT_376668 [Ganoderma leucocontextum]